MGLSEAKVLHGGVKFAFRVASSALALHAG